MSISAQDRALMEAVALMGPRMVDYLEMIGIESFAALAHEDPHELRVRINAHLGRPHINAMGVRALANVIAAAQVVKSGM